MGTTKFTFSVDHNETISRPYDYDISVYYDFTFFYDVNYSNKVSTAVANKVADELRSNMEKLARAVIALMPNTKLTGKYYYGWYEYPTIRVGYKARRYYTWVNYSPKMADSPKLVASYEDAKITGFAWDSFIDDKLGR